MAWEHERVLILYHGADMDGWCSGELAAIYCEERLKEGPVRFYGANYVPGKDDIRALVGEMPSLRVIYIVDYHIPVQDMYWLLNSGYAVVWCDHHVSAFREYEGHLAELTENAGFVCNLGKDKSGALLAYEALFGSEPVEAYPNMKNVAELVSVYDTWQAEHHSWPRAKALNTGLMGQVHPPKGVLRELFASEEAMERVIDKGHLFLEKEYERNRKLCDSWAGVLEWEGLRFLTLNGHGNSSLFESSDYPHIFDACMVWKYSGPNRMWQVSMYSLASSPADLDMSGIAKKYGGGGHARACGFMAKDLPFDVASITPVPEK